MLFVRELQTDERQALDQAANNPSLDWSQRARIILLSAASKTVPDISAEVRLHPINVRKWIRELQYPRLGRPEFWQVTGAPAGIFGDTAPGDRRFGPRQSEGGWFGFRSLVVTAPP